MDNQKAAAIAASAYNVCGPRSGEFAKPSTIGQFSQTEVLRCIDLYASAHDGSMFTRTEILAARDLLA